MPNELGSIWTYFSIFVSQTNQKVFWLHQESEVLNQENDAQQSDLSSVKQEQIELQKKVDKLEEEKSELIKQLDSEEGKGADVVQDLAKAKGK